MLYASVAEAKDKPGLRLVLSTGVPGPWGELAKNIFFVKKINFLPVAQEGGGPNTDLKAWTNIRNAPIAVYNNEKPRDNWYEIAMLAERLNPDIPLFPTDAEQRATVVGLGFELSGEWGLGWCRRAELLPPGDKPDQMEFFRSEYGITKDVAAKVPQRSAQIVQLFAKRMNAQRAAGSKYLVGSGLTVADVAWASFSNMLKPLPEELCPMPDFLRKGYAHLSPAVKDALDPILIEHRDFIYQRHLRLPLEF
jgi:glutathione S-transferase